MVDSRLSFSRPFNVARCESHSSKLRVTYAIRALRHLPHVGLLSVRLEALAPVDIVVDPRLTRYWNEGKLEGGVPIGIPGRSILMRAAEAQGPTGKITLAVAQTLLFDRMSAATPALGKGVDGETLRLDGVGIDERT